MRFLEFAENLPDVVWICTCDLQKIIYVNPAYEKVWRQSAEYLYKNPNAWLESLHPEDRSRAYNAFLNLDDQQKSVSIEYRLQKTDGSFRWIRSHGFLLRNEYHGVSWKAGIAYDITEGKEAERLARQYQAELAQITRTTSMNQMVSTLAHELNQPLTAINSYISGCIHRIEAGTLQKEELLSIMKKAVKNAELAGNIIHRMKNFVCQGDLVHEQENINEIVKEAVTFIHYEMDNVPLSFRFELSENLPSVMIDKIQMQQVLLNLLRNSIEAMIEINVANPTITLKTSLLDARNIIVSVCDRGPGISPENMSSVFKQYFTTKSKNKNMGMGLAICFNIIEAHGGHISARTIAQGGACFEFTLPVKKEN